MGPSGHFWVKVPRKTVKFALEMREVRLTFVAQFLVGGTLREASWPPKVKYTSRKSRAYLTVSRGNLDQEWPDGPVAWISAFDVVQTESDRVGRVSHSQMHKSSQTIFEPKYFTRQSSAQSFSFCEVREFPLSRLHSTVSGEFKNH